MKIENKLRGCLHSKIRCNFTISNTDTSFLQPKLDLCTSIKINIHLYFLSTALAFEDMLNLELLMFI